ncbi:hypothetical protein [Fusibacter sp. 3D3]|uniref:hypothetical protein n=1 Tax=Fusibacter sp. 3D3 TaxID=1048380 RepID=UPI000852FC1C|nr:hypothetical protein [Fusibacter sp. 3D3]GAU79992.1 hypothetical protein F3D3_4657 [Fusibacter sp. 3D3]
MNMSKLAKKSGKLTLTFLIVLCIVSLSFASTYYSNLTISGNSRHYGAGRSYDAGTMKIGVKFDTLNNPQYSNTIYVGLEEKSGWLYNAVSSTEKDFPKDTLVTSNFGFHKNGTYRFNFCTYGYNLSGGTANYVIMGNY